MKVSIIIPFYGDRCHQLERSIPFLDNQIYDDYEVILVDDGANGELPELGEHFKYVFLRDYSEYIRAPNIAIHRGFEESSGDFIIMSQPELLVPYDAIERTLNLSDMDRRNVATQFHLTFQQVNYLKTINGWKDNFDLIKSVPDFWSTTTPWLYINQASPGYRTHFSWSCSTRERFEKFMIPVTEEWGNEDCYVHAREADVGEPSVGLNLEVYHQEHERVYGTRPEYSVRMRRIMNSSVSQ